MNESSKRTALTIEQIRHLLKPLIDISTCERTSISNLQKNKNAILSKLQETDIPVLVHATVQGEYSTFILCNACMYFEMETQRRLFFSPEFQNMTIDDFLKIGKVEMANDLYSKLADMEREAYALKSELKEAEWKMRTSQAKLHNLEQEIENLRPFAK